MVGIFEVDQVNHDKQEKNESAYGHVHRVEAAFAGPPCIGIDLIVRWAGFPFAVLYTQCAPDMNDKKSKQSCFCDADKHPVHEVMEEPGICVKNVRPSEEGKVSDQVGNQETDERQTGESGQEFF